MGILPMRATIVPSVETVKTVRLLGGKGTGLVVKCKKVRSQRLRTFSLLPARD